MISCSAPYDCASPRPLLLVSSKVQLHILRVIRHRLTRSKDKTHQDKSRQVILADTTQRNTVHQRHQRTCSLAFMIIDT